MVDSIRCAPGQRRQIFLGRGEGSTENNGVDILDSMRQ